MDARRPTRTDGGIFAFLRSMFNQRTPGRVAVAIIFGLLSLNALLQAGLAAAGRSDDPLVLTLLQVMVGTAAAAAAWATWTGARWGRWAALAYGLVTAGMLMALGPLLALEPEARSGLWLGALVVLLASAAAAWYLHRRLGTE